MIFLVISYLIFLAGFIIFSLAGIYHLRRFGYVGDFTHPVIISYVILSAIIIILTLITITFRSWPTAIG